VIPEKDLKCAHKIFRRKPKPYWDKYTKKPMKEVEKFNAEQRKRAKKFKVGDLVTSHYSLYDDAYEVFRIKKFMKFNDGSIMIALEDKDGYEFWRFPKDISKMKLSNEAVWEILKRVKEY
jgi:hypothetical protein